VIFFGILFRFKVNGFKSFNVKIEVNFKASCLTSKSKSTSKSKAFAPPERPTFFSPKRK